MDFDKPEIAGLAGAMVTAVGFVARYGPGLRRAAEGILRRRRGSLDTLLAGMDASEGARRAMAALLEGDPTVSGAALLVGSCSPEGCVVRALLMVGEPLPIQPDADHAVIDLLAETRASVWRPENVADAAGSRIYWIAGDSGQMVYLSVRCSVEQGEEPAAHELVRDALRARFG